MMTRSRNWTILAAALALGLGGLRALAGPGAHGPHGHGAGHGPGLEPGTQHEMTMNLMAEALDLTEAQRVEIRGIFTRYHEGTLGQRQQAARGSRRELARLLHSEGATEKQVREAARRLAAEDERLTLERFHMLGEIRAVLTDEQRVKARELHERFEE